VATINIVRFSPEHAEGVFSVILPIQQAEFAIAITREEQADLADIPAFYQRGDGNFWVALADNTVVGTVAILDIGNREGALRKMFVTASHRGSEHGVAKRLLETLLAWCRARGQRQIYLGTTAQYLAAHRFYEKNGFREIGRNQLPSTFPVMAVDSKFYARAP